MENPVCTPELSAPSEMNYNMLKPEALHTSLLSPSHQTTYTSPQSGKRHFRELTCTVIGTKYYENWLMLISIKVQEWQNATFLDHLFIIFMLKVSRVFFVFPQMSLLKEKSPMTLNILDLNFEKNWPLEQRYMDSSSEWKSQRLCK